MGTWTTTPRTWVAGEIPTAAMFNSNLRDFGRAFSDAFTSYTPTLKDAGNNTLANWTCTGSYLQAGKFVMVKFDLLAGSSPGTGTGTWRINLPVNALTTGPANWSIAGKALILDNSDSKYTEPRISIDGSGYFTLWYLSAVSNGTQTGVSAGNPITTWAVNDRIVGQFAYEAA